MPLRNYNIEHPNKSINSNQKTNYYLSTLINYMLIIACSGMALYWPDGRHNGPRPKAECHYGCPKVNS